MKHVTSVLDVDFTLSPESAKIQAALRDEVAAHNAAVDGLNAEREKLKDKPRDEWNGADFVMATAIRDRHVGILGREIDLRKLLIEFLDRVKSTDWQQAKEAGFKRHEKLSSDVRAKLVKLGYEEYKIGSSMLNLHPVVREARIEHESLERFTGFHDHRNMHSAEIEKRQRELSGQVDKALAAVG